MARYWSDPVNVNKNRTDIHDLGFMVDLSIGHDYRYTGRQQARDWLIETAHSLAHRYVPAAGVVRSWDGVGSVSLPKDDVVVIIDSLMSMPHPDLIDCLYLCVDRKNPSIH
jgi:hypothetical protein